MGFAEKSLRALPRRMKAMGWPGRIGLVALVGLVVTGGVWLLRWGNAPQMLPVLDESVSVASLETTGGLLEAGQITHQTRDGKIYVPSETVHEGKGMLTRRESPTNGGGTFEQIFRDSDIWRTRGQNEKLWILAKMNALARAISDFPAVRSASVILEPGAPRRLGAARVAATAAVNVHLSDGARMTGQLLRAIRDLVAASVSGLQIEDVCVVDSSGKSYRWGADPERPVGIAADLEELLSAEAYYTEKILSALDYIPGLNVTVNVHRDAQGDRLVSASVSVPRSYLVGVYRTLYGAKAKVEGRRLEAIAKSQLAKVQALVARITDAGDPGQVKVDWYYDATTASALVGEGFFEDDHSLRKASFAVILAGFALMSIVLVLVRWGSRRTALNPSSTEQETSVNPQGEAEPATVEPEADRSPLAMLTEQHPARIAEMVKGEGPESIAIIMVHLDASKAAAVLDTLSNEVQAEVICGVMTLKQVDQQRLRELEQSLLQREGEVSDLEAGSTGGLAKAVEILRCAKSQTERNVLDALTEDSPELVRALHTETFTFEDIGYLSRSDLKGVLNSLDSEDLAVALRTAGPKVRKRIFSGLTLLGARRVRREMELVGPVRLSEVEAAQRRLVDAIRRAPRGRYVAEGDPKTAISHLETNRTGSG